MKQAGAIILLLVMVTVTFSKWVIIADFEINRNYIAKNLCINKNKPRSCCHGKCYLGKQMDKDEKEDNQNLPQKGKEKMDIQLFVETKDINEMITHKTFSAIGTYRQVFSAQSFLHNCFRPPRVTV